MFDYPVIVHHETASVWISCDDVPELASAGDTEEEALLDAIEGLETALSLYVERRAPIPLPSPAAAGQPVVRLPALSAAKAALWNAMLAQGVNKADMARRLGVNRPLRLTGVSVNRPPHKAPLRRGFSFALVTTRGGYGAPWGRALAVESNPVVLTSAPP
ncbi:Antitoxin HicB [compost metagenome]